MTDDPIVQRAATEAREVLAQFERLEALGTFVAKDVSEQKRLFLTFSLVNFANRERLFHDQQA